MLHVHSFLHMWSTHTCRDCDCSRTALFMSTNGPCSGSMFTRCDVQKSHKLLIDLCLPRPWCSALLGQDFKSRKQGSLQTDQLGLPCPASYAERVSAALEYVLPSHPQAYRAETQEFISSSLFSCRALSYGKKILSHWSVFKCASGPWISWRSLNFLKWIFVMCCTLRQSKQIYETI